MKSEHLIAASRLAFSIGVAISSGYQRASLLMFPCLPLIVVIGLGHGMISRAAISAVSAPTREDREAVAAIDKKYQAAVVTAAKQGQQQQCREAWMACHPSLAMSGTRAKAAIGSAHGA
ncbi:MAG: hypothetical protein DMG39_15940 [Acidobacteria bacterium]|nr:MAG: hypothetical protein DMG39_15940 [Acidobacteriota bacterium]